MEEIDLSNQFPKLKLEDVPLKVLAICGSPRKESSSQILLDIAVEGAKSAGNVEVEYYSMYGQKINGCKGCNAYCLKNKDCVNKYGFQEFVQKWLRAEAIIWSFPVYTMGGPGQMHALHDRMGEVHLANRIDKIKAGEAMPQFMKACGLICQGSSRFGNQEIVMERMIDHLLTMDCIPVCGDMPHSHIGVPGHVVHGTKPHDEDGLLTQSREIGMRVAQVGKMLKLGKYAIADSLRDTYFCSPDSFADTKRPEVE